MRSGEQFNKSYSLLLAPCSLLHAPAAPVILLWLFGLVTIPLGLWLWNGLAPHYGLGASRGQVDPSVAYGALILVITVVALELVFL